MHETFENFSFGSDFQTVAAHGRLDSGGLDRYPDRRSSASFLGMEIDRRQPPVLDESPSGGGLGWQIQPEGTRQQLRFAASWHADKIRPRRAKQESPTGVCRREWLFFASQARPRLG